MRKKSGQLPDVLRGTEIETALVAENRQYLVGNLTRPQALRFLYDGNIEIGMASYADHEASDPHVHTDATEYVYMLSGRAALLELESGKEEVFHAGDFIIIRPDTRFMMKYWPATRLLFIKHPGGNDKQCLSMDDALREWGQQG